MVGMINREFRYFEEKRRTKTRCGRQTVIDTNTHTHRKQPREADAGGKVEKFRATCNKFLRIVDNFYRGFFSETKIVSICCHPQKRRLLIVEPQQTRKIYQRSPWIASVLEDIKPHQFLSNQIHSKSSITSSISSSTTCRCHLLVFLGDFVKLRIRIRFSLSHTRSHSRSLQQLCFSCTIKPSELKKMSSISEDSVYLNANNPELDSGSGGNEEVFLFTSESVGEGHPDKLCDQVSDAILDAYLALDAKSKVACEVAVKSNFILVFGEVTSTGTVDIKNVVRETIKRIGYDSEEKGFDYKTCDIMVALEKQSPEIAQGVHVNRPDEEVGAGDQGLMFGYATNETEECMPLTVVLAHKLNQKISELRCSGAFSWARPDTKTQVTCEYRFLNGAAVPTRVHTVVVSVQHSETIHLDELRSEILNKVIKEVIPSEYLDDDTIYHINPCGNFILGGPGADAGLTGRKIIVDTYGGWGGHGGGAFSGKDPTKVDRSAAYAARWVAKSLVKAGLCRRCLVQVSYAIGIAEPLSITVFSFGTSQFSQKQLVDIVNQNFDLRPGLIIRDLSLNRPIYEPTSCYGHFGRKVFPWENPKELELGEIKSNGNGTWSNGNHLNHH